MAYLFQKKYRGSDGKPRKCSKWTIRYYDCQGRRHEVPGYRCKKATQTKALQLELKAEREDAGIHDPADDYRFTPISQHIDDMKHELVRKGRPESYTAMKASRIAKLLARCKRLGDITEDRVLEALRGLSCGAQTRNHYLQAAKQFCLWAIRKKRLKDNPLVGLQAENVRIDPDLKIRRALSPAEVGKVLHVTRNSKKVFRRLSGADRAMLYLVAASTGLRARELASLTAADFILESDCPAIRLHAANDKARRGVEQPLPLAIVPQLTRYLDRKPPGEKVWGSSWRGKAYAMVRSDLQEAGIPRKTAEGVFDFHAWRHTYISLLSMTGLQPKVVQDLARHSDIRLTMGRYAHTQKSERQKAANLIPSFTMAG